jgi:hypothetical protein
MSLETAQKVIVPQKKNYVPHFLKQRDINSYFPTPLLLLLMDPGLIKSGYEIRIRNTTQD